MVVSSVTLKSFSPLRSVASVPSVSVKATCSSSVNPIFGNTRTPRCSSSSRISPACAPESRVALSAPISLPIRGWISLARNASIDMVT